MPTPSGVQASPEQQRRSQHPDPHHPEEFIATCLRGGPVTRPAPEKELCRSVISRHERARSPQPDGLPLNVPGDEHDTGGPLSAVARRCCHEAGS